MAVSPWSGASWLSINDIYVDNALVYQSAQTAYNLSPTKPFFHIEGYYENEHAITNQALRAQAYWAVLSGGFGYVFGNCPMWSFAAPVATSFCGSGGKCLEGATDCNGSAPHGSYVKQLFSSLSWYNLVPGWSHTTLTGGYGSYGSSNYVTAGRSSDGSLVISPFLPSSRTVSVDMSKLAGSSVTARWYDPTNGSYTTVAGSPFSNTGTRQFVPSVNNAGGDGDWVLVLTASSSPLPTPTPTRTPTPTQTPVPTNTPVPTTPVTLMPSPTPTTPAASVSRLISRRRAGSLCWVSGRYRGCLRVARKWLYVWLEY